MTPIDLAGMSFDPYMLNKKYLNDANGRTMETYLSKLKQAKIITRKEPKVGGYWEILH